jgi:hypothetical protein
MEEGTAADLSAVSADDSTVVVNRLAQLAIGLIPALVAALAAIGSATGGLSRLFRDQNHTATVAVALVLISVVLAAFSRGLGTPSAKTVEARGFRFSPRLRTAGKASLLLLSVAVLFSGLFIAVNAQIRVMGTSQAPEIAGNVRRDAKEYVFEGDVKASGVTSDSRITIFAYQTNDDADTLGKPVLLQSSSGPNADGLVNVPLRVPIHSDLKYHLMVVTAVLGEHQRDCDGRLVDNHTEEPDIRTVACLVVRLP